LRLSLVDVVEEAEGVDALAEGGASLLLRAGKGRRVLLLLARSEIFAADKAKNDDWGGESA
jgi:hypothetical protein